ncbi:hypothetical protein GCM10027059_47600 [Myceligenerans halotolerans]
MFQMAESRRADTTGLPGDTFHPGADRATTGHDVQRLLHHVFARPDIADRVQEKAV